MAGSSLANRLYRGEAGLNIVGRRKMWFTIAAVAVLISIASFVTNGFHRGIEFAGGTKIQVPASVGSLDEARGAVERAVAALPPSADGKALDVASAQRVSNGPAASYQIRTSELNNEQSLAVKNAVAADFGIPADQVSDSRVSAAWGSAVTKQAIIGLLIFVALVMVYLIVRFEWRMAVAAVSPLLPGRLLPPGAHSPLRFRGTPSTVIGLPPLPRFPLHPPPA